MMRAGTFRFALGILLMAGSAAFGIAHHISSGKSVDPRLSGYAACERMQIRSENGTTILAELALSPKEQTKGLQNREALDPDGGMIFIFPEPNRPDFWMKDVAFPLDMIFIAEGGTVLDLHLSAEPGSEEVITPLGPVIAVIESAPGRFGDLALGTQLGFDCLQDETGDVVS